MQKEQFENAITLAALIASKGDLSKSVMIARNIAKLQRLSVSLRKRYEAQCSYQWADTPDYETRTANLESKARILGQEIGIVIEHQSDPRGAALKFTFADRECSIF